jgi:hypothetical protein
MPTTYKENGAVHSISAKGPGGQSGLSNICELAAGEPKSQFTLPGRIRFPFLAAGKSAATTSVLILRR